MYDKSTGLKDKVMEKTEPKLSQVPLGEDYQFTQA